MPPPQPTNNSSDYRAPVTKKQTVKMMLYVAIFMIVGTVILTGISYLAERAG